MRPSTSVCDGNSKFIFNRWADAFTNNNEHFFSGVACCVPNLVDHVLSFAFHLMDNPRAIEITIFLTQLIDVDTIGTRWCWSVSNGRMEHHPRHTSDPSFSWMAPLIRRRRLIHCHNSQTSTLIVWVLIRVTHSDDPLENRSVTGLRTIFRDKLEYRYQFV